MILKAVENISSCAIIAEYNPFHNGHLYHISKTKEILGDTTLICIMSGNFTQRGEPAVTDKWTRAKWAVENGCDLVIELPLIYAIQSANRFAGGATGIIKGLNGISHISFGCETNDLDMLRKVASYKNTNDYSFRLNMALKSGNTFARAHEIAVSKLNVDGKLLSGSPNCILAQEYLSFINDSHVNPIVVKRTGSYNDDTLLKGITSATSIRKAITAGNLNLESCMPYSVFKVAKSITPVLLDDFFQIILSRIFYLKADGLKQIHEITEGLENRIYQSALKAKTLTELLESIKTKRYLYTRLQRIMLYIIFNITKEFMQSIDDSNLPVYARILAISSRKQNILSNFKPSIPVVSKAADYKQNMSSLQADIFEKDVLATELYSIFSPIRPNEDFLHGIIKVN